MKCSTLKSANASFALLLHLTLTRAVIDEKSSQPSIQLLLPNFSVKKGEDVEIIKIEGSVEIAPVLGLADAIIDIVETGSTLKENGLLIYEKMYPISARLIVNKASLKQNKTQIFQLIDQLEQVIKEERAE